MSNARYYAREDALRDHIRTMPADKLRKFMDEWLKSAPVSIVENIIRGLDAPMPPDQDAA